MEYMRARQRIGGDAAGTCSKGSIDFLCGGGGGDKPVKKEKDRLRYDALAADSVSPHSSTPPPGNFSSDNGLRGSPAFGRSAGAKVLSELLLCVV